MKRRAVLNLGAGAGIFVLAAGHGLAALAADDRLLLADLEPDGLWPIYRRYRLLIVGQRDDEAASAFARSVVDVLAREIAREDHEFQPMTPAERKALAKLLDDLPGSNWRDR